MNSELMDRELSNARDGFYRAIPRAPGILIADDVGLILTMLKLELELLGFSVWLAVDGDGAVNVYRQHHDKIDLVLLDAQMAGLDGPRTLAALRLINPEIRACFMTGGSDRYTEEDLLACGAACVVGKPFRAAEIAHLLQQLARLRFHNSDAPTFTEKERNPCTYQDD